MLQIRSKTGGGVMKKIIIMFLVGVICTFTVSAFAIELNFDSGTHINRSSNTGPVIRAYYDGNSSSSAIHGYATSPTGVTYGIVGKVDSPDGYAGYFQGKLGVEGAIKNPNTVWGIIGLPVYVDDNMSITGDLYVDGSISTRNLARNPEEGVVTAIAKTEHAGGYTANNAIDGIKGLWDSGEWASNGEKNNTWIQLNWSVPQTITRCVFYDRSNRFDNITDAHLLIDQTGDGIAEYYLHLGAFPIGGAAKEVNLTSAQGSNVSAMKLYITESVPSSINVGLSEWECY